VVRTLRVALPPGAACAIAVRVLLPAPRRGDRILTPGPAGEPPAEEPASGRPAQGLSPGSPSGEARSRFGEPAEGVIAFAEDFNAGELDNAKWLVTRKNDFSEFAVDVVRVEPKKGERRARETAAAPRRAIGALVAARVGKADLQRAHVPAVGQDSGIDPVLGPFSTRRGVAGLHTGRGRSGRYSRRRPAHYLCFCARYSSTAGTRTSKPLLSR